MDSIKEFFSLRSFGLFFIGIGLTWWILGYQQAHSDGPAVATVNGDVVSQKEFYNYMKVAGGNEALTHLIEVTAILHAAKQENLTVDKTELGKVMSQLKAEPKDPGVKAILEQEGRAHLLLRKLVLKNVSDAEMHKFYDTFKPDLTQYELEAIAPKAPEDIANIERDLKSGRKFEDVADTYPSSLDAKAHGYLGKLTYRALLANLGQDAAVAIIALQPGEASGRLISNAGAIFVKMVAKHDSFDDLKPRIEDIMVEAGRNAEEDKLMAQATITSPFISPSSSPSASPAASPAASK
ncbi:MAG: peptidylprolyl isomerase [Candidatus Xenobia bacterium]